MAAIPEEVAPSQCSLPFLATDLSPLLMLSRSLPRRAILLSSMLKEYDDVAVNIHDADGSTSYTAHCYHEFSKVTSSSR
jgi:hypothetical protein